MAFVFVDDGSPEAADDSLNYIWYDEKDSTSRAAVLEEARSRALAMQGDRAPIGWMGLPSARRQKESEATYASMTARSPSLPGRELPCSMPTMPVKPRRWRWPKIAL